MSSLFTCKNIFSLFNISQYFIAQQKDTNRMTTNKISIFKTTQITSTNLKFTQLVKSCFLTCRQTHTWVILAGWTILSCVIVWEMGRINKRDEVSGHWSTQKHSRADIWCRSQTGTFTDNPQIQSQPAEKNLGAALKTTDSNWCFLDTVRLFQFVQYFCYQGS